MHQYNINVTFFKLTGRSMVLYKDWRYGFWRYPIEVMIHKMTCYMTFRISFVRDFVGYDKSTEKIDLANHCFERLENVVKFIAGVIFRIEPDDIAFSKHTFPT